MSASTPQAAPVIRWPGFARAANRVKQRILVEIVRRFPFASTRSETLRNLLKRIRSECAPELTIELRSELDFTVALDYPRADIRLGAESRTAILRQFACRKEPWTVSWIERSVQDGDVFYDIGANVGAYSLIAAKQPAQVSVVAFEPSFENYAALCANIARNRCECSITPVPLALGRYTSLQVFNYRERGTGKALHTLGDAVDQDGNAYEPQLRQRMLAVSLDDTVRLLGLPSPALIKLDVDGTEMDILGGADSVLQNPILRSALIETNEPRVSVGDLVAYMKERGMKLAARYERPPPKDVLYLLFDRDRRDRI